MDKYRRVERRREDPPIGPNEVRITAVGKRKAYISYAIQKFEDGEKSIQLKAMGRAMSKAVTVAEIVKRRVANLHQTTEISSNTIVDLYEPLEEGLKQVEVTRRVSAITVTLSKDPLDSNNAGYQPPIDQSEVQAEDKDRVASKRGRGRGRGRGWGRGRGRGRGGRGRGRGRPSSGDNNNNNGDNENGSNDNDNNGINNDDDR